jgi:hypothetical protein
LTNHVSVGDWAGQELDEPAFGDEHALQKHKRLPHPRLASRVRWRGWVYGLRLQLEGQLAAVHGGIAE